MHGSTPTPRLLLRAPPLGNRLPPAGARSARSASTCLGRRDQGTRKTSSKRFAPPFLLSSRRPTSPPTSAAAAATRSASAQGKRHLVGHSRPSVGQEFRTPLARNASHTANGGAAQTWSAAPAAKTTLAGLLLQAAADAEAERLERQENERLAVEVERSYEEEQEKQRQAPPPVAVASRIG